MGGQCKKNASSDCSGRCFQGVDGLAQPLATAAVVLPRYNGSSRTSALAALKPLPLLEAPGLRTVLRSDDFGAWDSLVAGTLGHHRSRLLPGSPPFSTHIRWGAVAEFEVLLLHGRGRVELRREQEGHGVLWLPLQGLTQEWVNGVERVAEPGMALLFRPGDAMRGLTSDAITGLSIPDPRGLPAGC